MTLQKDQAAELRLRLPASSANVGPAFDAAAIALDLYLDIEAVQAEEFSIIATGRDAARCSQIHNNLILETYKSLLKGQGISPIPLAIHMANGIPLGMGLGSSAAGRLAAIALANHFGNLGWSSARILAEASSLEGHPDNTTACWHGGFILAAMETTVDPATDSATGQSDPVRVQFARVDPPAAWRPIVVLPNQPLATSEARAMLPATYSRADVVANLQSAGLLGLAFAQGRADLLRIATADRVHQPYRAPICPLLNLLLPLAHHSNLAENEIPANGILSATLSGAGPSVLIITASDSSIQPAINAIQTALAGALQAEILPCRFEPNGPGSSRDPGRTHGPGISQIPDSSL